MFHEYNFTLHSLYIVANALLFILAKWKKPLHLQILLQDS